MLAKITFMYEQSLFSLKAEIPNIQTELNDCLGQLTRGKEPDISGVLKL
jgi:hypothetical protein